MTINTRSRSYTVRVPGHTAWTTSVTPKQAIAELDHAPRGARIFDRDDEDVTTAVKRHYGVAYTEDAYDLD